MVVPSSFSTLPSSERAVRMSHNALTCSQVFTGAAVELAEAWKLSANDRNQLLALFAFNDHESLLKDVI